MILDEVDFYKTNNPMGWIRPGQGHNNKALPRHQPPGLLLCGEGRLFRGTKRGTKKLLRLVSLEYSAVKVRASLAKVVFLAGLRSKPGLLFDSNAKLRQNLRKGKQSGLIIAQMFWFVKRDFYFFVYWLWEN